MSNTNTTQAETNNCIKLDITDPARENLDAEPYRRGDIITEVFNDMDGMADAED